MLFHQLNSLDTGVQTTGEARLCNNYVGSLVLHCSYQSQPVWGGIPTMEKECVGWRKMYMGSERMQFFRWETAINLMTERERCTSWDQQHPERA